MSQTVYHRQPVTDTDCLSVTAFSLEDLVSQRQTHLLICSCHIISWHMSSHSLYPALATTLPWPCLSISKTGYKLLPSSKVNLYKQITVFLLRFSLKWIYTLSRTIYNFKNTNLDNNNIVSVLLFTSVERFFVSHMQEFFVMVPCLSVCVFLFVCMSVQSRNIHLRESWKKSGQRSYC